MEGALEGPAPETQGPAPRRARALPAWSHFTQPAPVGTAATLRPPRPALTAPGGTKVLQDRGWTRLRGTPAPGHGRPDPASRSPVQTRPNTDTNRKCWRPRAQAPQQGRAGVQSSPLHGDRDSQGRTEGSARPLARTGRRTATRRACVKIHQQQGGSPLFTAGLPWGHGVARGQVPPSLLLV